eukprot:1147332-Pelagomonas_calceolata.AAC.1
MAAAIAANSALTMVLVDMAAAICVWHTLYAHFFQSWTFRTRFGLDAHVSGERGRWLWMMS